MFEQRHEWRARGCAGGAKPAAEIAKSIDKAAVDGVVKLDDVKQDRGTEKIVRGIKVA